MRKDGFHSYFDASYNNLAFPLILRVASYYPRYIFVLF